MARVIDRTDNFDMKQNINCRDGFVVPRSRIQQSVLSGPSEYGLVREDLMAISFRGLY
jgi:hypothetical protein